MRKFHLTCLALLAIAACNPEDETGNGGASISVDFTSDKESAAVGETVVFHASVSGGVKPYTYEWDFGDGITSSEADPEVVYEEPGVKLISLNVTDSKGNKATRPKTRTFAVEAAQIEDKGDVTIAWYVDFEDAGGGIRGSVPAIDDQGNVYIVTSVNAAGQLRKVSPDGSVLGSVAINPAPGNSCASVSIDSEGNVYAGGGSGAGGSFHKFSSSLSDLWSAAFWNKGNAAEPKIWYGAAVQLDDVVLVANAGSTGTVGAVSKADGSRISYITSSEGGGPSGGCRQSPVVSKDGYVWQVCAANGIIGAPLASLKNGGAVVYDWFSTNSLNEDGSTVELASIGSDRPAHCAVSVNGEVWCAGACTAKTSGLFQLYIIDKDGNYKVFTVDGVNTSAANTVEQDQGGVIVGAQGEIIANMKAGAVADGGIVAVDPSTMTLSWEYRIAEDVSCVPALTKEGNVVFGTDDGSFYIIKPDYASKGAELLAKANINDLIQEAGMSYAEGFANFNIKMWSGIAVGDDGRMYVGFQKNDDPTSSGILCLTSDDVTGPGASEWPMFGADRKHTGEHK